MRLLVLCLFLASAAHATSVLAGQLTSGQISWAMDDPTSGSIFHAPGHTILGDAQIQGCNLNPCPLDVLKAQGSFLAGVLWMTVDGIGYKSGDGWLFKESTFNDVVSGDFLTVTGQAVIDPSIFGDQLTGYDPPWGPTAVRFSVPHRWKYTSTYLLDHDGGQNGGEDVYRIQALTVTSVPEPGSFLLLFVGALALLYYHRQAARCRRFIVPRSPTKFV